MGQEIVYCYNCQTRLLGSDFEKGLAFRVGAQSSCPECVRGLFASLTPEDADAEIERLKITQLSKKAVSTSRIPIVRSSPPDTTTRNKVVAESGPPKSKLPLIVGVVVVVGVVLLIALFSGSPERRTSTAAVDPPAPAPTPVPVPVPGPGAELPAGAFVELDRQIASRIGSDDFSAAARDLERARSRRGEAAWLNGIEERRAQVEKKAMAALPGFVEPALAAHHEGRADEVERLRSFIAAFPAVALEFDRRLGERAPTPVPNPTPGPTPKPAPSKPTTPKPAPSEAASYKGAWDKAMAARDPAKIVSSLEGAIKGLKTAEAKTEAAQDLGLLKSAINVRADGAALAAKLPKDQKVKLDFSDDSMVVGSFEGTLQSIDPVRLRLNTETGALDLPVSELSEETLARLVAARSPADAKAAATFCALRGLAEAAEKLDPALPKKYLDFAKKPAAAGDADADRRAFWIGFTEASMTRSRAAGLDRLSKLNSPRFKPFVDFLMDGAKEAFFSGTDIAATGTFAAHEREKVGAIWMSSADVKTGWSTAEVEYYALPDQAYKAWVYAGGCCQEVFQFSMQTPGLKGIDAKSKEEMAYEVGDQVGMPVRLPSLSLKKIHSQHLGPKEPDRWEWIALPLPKPDAAGPKKIRLLTDQKGFSVAHVVVSATRKSPPSSTEVKELLRDRVTAPRFVVAAGPATGKPTKTAHYGGNGGADFEEMGPAGAVLVGFKWSAKGSGGRMKYLQAIYRLSDTVTRGGGHGQSDSGGELLAKPGYAVGQIVLSSSDRLDGFKLVYMRQAGGRLLTGDTYESAWVGAPLKGETKTAGDGSPIAGIFGKAGGEVDGIGLILLK
jgi:hypothetical protein